MGASPESAGRAIRERLTPQLSPHPVTVTPMFEASAGGGPGRPSAPMLAQAEELLATLPGVVSVRIEATPAGDVVAIHVLTSVEVAPKQTVRNIESALLAHLGLRVDHRKVSVATTVDAPRLRPAGSAGQGSATRPAATPVPPVPPVTLSSAAPAIEPTPLRRPTPVPAGEPVASRTPVVPFPVPAIEPAPAAPGTATRRRTPAAAMPAVDAGRRYVFDDVEVRRSRTGLHCRVTLRRGDESFEGEAEGLETEAVAARLTLAARAAVLAIAYAEGRTGELALAGVTRVEAFDRAFAFAGVTVRQARESTLLSGTCEIREGVEVAGVLAVLDATNRWLAAGR